MAINEPFHDACERWLRVALPRLEPITRLPPEEQDATIRRLPGWEFRFFVINHPEAGFLAGLTEGSLETLAETRDLLELVRSDEHLASALLVDADGQPDHRLIWFVDSYLRRFCLVYLENLRPLSFALQETTFEATYALLEQFIYAPNTVALDSIFQIHNVSPIDLSDDEDFLAQYPLYAELATGVILRRPTEAEVSEAMRYPMEWHGTESVSSGILFGRNLLVEVQTPLSELSNPADPAQRRDAFAAAEQPLSFALHALRLLKPEPVIRGPVRHRPDNPFMFMLAQTVASPEADRFHMDWMSERGEPDQTPIYALLEEDVPELVRLYQLVSRAGPDDRLALALSRFDDSYSRRRSEDVLIDAWIAMESLFASDGPPDLTYKIAMRVARFLGVLLSIGGIFVKQSRPATRPGLKWYTAKPTAGFSGARAWMSLLPKPKVRSGMCFGLPLRTSRSPGPQYWIRDYLINR